MKKLLLKNCLLYICCSLCLLAAGWYAHCWHLRSNNTHKERRVKASGYRLTSPLLDVELPEGVTISHEPLSFKYKLADYVNKSSDGTVIKSISVYFRDLGDGPWFGINDQFEFNPASMMKVPVMIAWLKRAEKNPSVLQQTFLFDNATDMSAIQRTKPRLTLSRGQRYPIETLLTYMMSYSDNNATSILYNNMTTKELNEVLDGMDITNRPGDDNNSTTVHGYSGFFRILYNASFLNREMSERALQLLSLEDFPQGISAGVPKGVTVAAKFGEYTDNKITNGNQLHEFGIVYHPKGHYILGIMTKGSDFSRQTEIIREISAIVYQEVDSGTAISTSR
jgi:beta-lactamase class A